MFGDYLIITEQPWHIHSSPIRSPTIGLESRTPSAEQLEGLDQFHSRGLAATVDMARNLQPSGMTVLDTAFLETHRAVSEVLERPAFSFTVEGDDPAKT
jgi:hypothetical protein